MATRGLLPIGVPRRDEPAQARFKIDVRLRRVRRCRSSRACACSGCRTSASTNVTITHRTQTMGSGGTPRPTAIRPPTRWSPRPTTWTSITRRSACPESITRSTSRSGTTTAAAGDRPQSVDPGPVSKHAVPGPRHVALAAEDLFRARYPVDTASIDAGASRRPWLITVATSSGQCRGTTNWRRAPREHSRSKLSGSIGIAKSLSSRPATAAGSGVPTATSDLRWCTLDWR